MAGTANRTVWQRVRETALPLVSADTEGAVLPVLGTRALVLHRIDAAEHARRRTADAERLDGFAALECLLALPVDLPVPVDSLGSRERAVLRRLPRGAAEFDGGTVTRRAVRPLAVDLAVVRAADWRTGLERAGRFAPFCSRAVLLDRLPGPELDAAVMDASFYGIGVLLSGPDGIRSVLAPAEYRPQRHTAAAWHFAEGLYERLR
ncbi:hypothetical protein [Streptomyces sp. NRRL B-24484]|uniref:hypothetical protein n=1 Tax=Streptomyces sp. NRRL B-24484 TaxID=1463833 RepID=UPI0007C50924|nr:hypothetical protein [Streptomyces sp. NRRL B-24484]